jgi:hypothetical protein
LCPFEGTDQANVTVPAATVLGVGLKKSLATVIVVLAPPPPPPPPPPYGDVESEHPASARMATVLIQNV